MFRSLRRLGTNRSEWNRSRIVDIKILSFPRNVQKMLEHELKDEPRLTAKPSSRLRVGKFMPKTPGCSTGDHGGIAGHFNIR